MTTEREVLIKDRRHKPTVGLVVGDRQLNVLSWKGLVSIASGIAILYAATQTVGAITGFNLTSRTARKIDKLADAIATESQIRSAADSESRMDRQFLREQMGDLILTTCGALTEKSSRVIHERCDQILTKSYNRR